jgi:hypothetical protein
LIRANLGGCGAGISLPQFNLALVWLRTWSSEFYLATHPCDRSRLCAAQLAAPSCSLVRCKLSKFLRRRLRSHGPSHSASLSPPAKALRARAGYAPILMRHGCVRVFVSATDLRRRDLEGGQRTQSAGGTRPRSYSLELRAPLLCAPICAACSNPVAAL